MNIDNSNLAKGGIFAASLPNYTLFVFGRWQQKWRCACYDW